MESGPLIHLIRLILALSLAGPINTIADDAEDFFEKRIRPILAEHCLECHSTHSKIRGGLSLDSLADVLKGGDTGPALIPNQPEQSLLISAVEHRNPDLTMPAKKPKLPDSVIADLVSWIRSGARWPGTTASPTPRDSFDLANRKIRLPWIWETPTRHTPPDTSKTHAASDIDRFLHAKLESAGLQPAPPTDDRTWLRRVHFTLTGLPPTPESIRAFLGDPSPARREHLVDALLASDHFGERWARHWMDLVRYAESRGHESDFPIPNAWQYRDYLVRAFNADVPFNRFVAEHVAGDLLPARTHPVTGANESVLGTGWAFLGEEVHSPVDIRQDECERVDNKIDVLSKTFLGLTVACARCHDHKFDAISQSDYYALAGFVLGSNYRQVRFETMEQHARIAQDLERLRSTHREPVARDLAESLIPRLGDLPRLLVAAHRLAGGGDIEEISRSSGIQSALVAAWTNHLHHAAATPRHPLHAFAKISLTKDAHGLPEDDFRQRLATVTLPVPATPPPGVRILLDFTGVSTAPLKSDGPGFGTRPLAAGEIVLGTSAARPIERVMPTGAAHRDTFWNRLALESGTEGESGSHAATARAGRMIHTPTFELASGRLHYLIRGRTRVYAGVDSHIMVAGPLHAALVATLDGGQHASWVTQDLSAYAGHRTHLEFGPDGDHDLDVLMVVESPEKPAFHPVPIWSPSGNPTSFTSLVDALQSDFLEAARRLGSGALGKTPVLAVLADWLVQNTSLLPADGGTNAAPARSITAYTSAAEDLQATVRWTSATAVSWMDGSGVDEKVLIRGKPTRPGATAPRRLPMAFAMPEIAPPDRSGRAELARQLTDPANPLVARVFVNRIWQHVFGRGIVATPDNFGFLGERPTHPELLDHLAWQFIHEDQWSPKRMIRRLVLTDAFAMSSRAATGRALEADPSNTLLHRMPIRRLEGEAIRDALLSVSGRLDARIGGPPVPVHLTEFIIGRGRPERSGPLDGDGRRSIYTAAPRNFLPGMMLAFDLPTPFSTVGRRNTTNVPGQPLVLMNDPFVHQQARFWAGRLLRSLPAGSDESRITWLFETAFARTPDQAELVSCTTSLAELRALDGARNELDAWTHLGHALLNANEFIYLN